MDKQTKLGKGYKVKSAGVIIFILLLATAVFGQEIYPINDFSGGINIWAPPFKIKKNQFVEYNNLDPNLFLGSLSSRVGIDSVTTVIDISSITYAPWNRVFGVYDSQADTLAEFFFIGTYGSVNDAYHFFDQYRLGYSTPDDIETISDYTAGMHANSPVVQDEMVGHSFNSILRITSNPNTAHWVNNRYPVRSVIWYTPNIAKLFRVFGTDAEGTTNGWWHVAGVASAGVDYIRWIDDANLIPLIWTKRSTEDSRWPPLVVAGYGAGDAIANNTYYSFAYIYDGYQMSTMVEDSTGNIIIAEHKRDSCSAYTDVSIRFHYHTRFRTTGFPGNTSPDSLGHMNPRITAYAIFKNEVTDGDTATEKRNLDRFRYVGSLSPLDTTWSRYSIGDGSLYSDSLRDSTRYSLLTEDYRDMIGHFANYDMAVYKYASVLNGRRYCAVVAKPTKKGKIFNNNNRVYYNPLQTYTDPPSWAHDSFPDDHYVLLPGDNAEITGMFAFGGRLYVSTRGTLYRITPGGGVHDFSIQEVFGSYSVNNQRTVQVTPEGVFYKSFRSAVHFDGSTSKLIGEQLRQGDSLSYGKNVLNDVTSSWYDSQNKEYWMFDSTNTYIYSVINSGWRKYTFSIGSQKIHSVLGNGIDSLYIWGSSGSPESRQIWGYPSDTILTYIDGDSSVSIEKRLKTGRINMGSHLAEKDYLYYAITAYIDTISISAGYDSTMLVTININGEQAQVDTFKFIGTKTKVQALFSQTGSDIQFDITTSVHKFVLHSLELLWRPRNFWETGN